MSWTDKEMDQLFQEAAGGERASFKESYWTEMEALLNKEKKDPLGIWWWSGAGALLLIVSLGLFQPANMHKKLAQSTVNEQNEKQILAATLTKKENNINDGSKNDIIAERIVTDKMKSPSVNESSQLKPENGVSNSVKVKQHTSMKKTSVQTERNTAFKSDVQMQSQLQEEQVAQIVSEQSTSGKNELIHEASSLENKEGQHYGKQEKHSNAKNTANVSGKKEKTAELALERTLTKNSGAVNIERNYTTNTTRINVSSLSIRNGNLSQLENELQPSLQPSLLPPRRRWGMYAELHGGVGQSYATTKSDNLVYSYGATVGAEFYRGAWSFSAGIGLSQEHLKNVTCVIKDTYYSFGRIDVENTNHYNKLIFANLPIGVNYGINKHTIGLEARINYLLAVNVKTKASQREIVGGNEFKSQSSLNQGMVQSERFNNLGAVVGVRYAYQLKNNFSMGLVGTMRLNNLIKTEGFVGEINKNPLELKLTIRKSF